MKWRPDGLANHTLDRPPGLLEVDSVLDVGAGVRPMQWFTPKRHVCVEPSPVYAARLHDAGYEVLAMRANDALAMCSADSVYLLDVIEHMEKEEGLKCLELARITARQQVVVFTPMGFVEQSTDAWGLGEDSLQTHRSGWFPNDFPGWSTKRADKGFFAVWNRQ